MMNWDKIFNSVCRVVLKDEPGQLKDYEQFLGKYVTPISSTDSCLSGKKVYHSEEYDKGMRIISFEESNQMKIESLQLDEMKDIDSLIAAASERFHYAGNKILGNSDDVQESESIFDSVHVYRSTDIRNCETVYQSQMLVNGSKFVFGCAWGDSTTFSIRVSDTCNVSRSFESGLLFNASDAYFSYNCVNCNEVMFCFNQRSKRHAIGNRGLERGKYEELKKKLLAEVVDELKRKKTFPTLMEMCFGGSA